MPDPEFFKNFIFICCLSAAAAEDIKTQRIPNRIILFCLFNLFVALLLNPEGCSLGSGLGAFVLCACLYCLMRGFTRMLKKKALGGGDIKLISAISLYLGMESTLIMIVVMCVSSLAFAFASGNLKQRFPLAPFIGFGTGLAMLLS